MSQLISFLESLGQDARLAKLSGEEYTAAVDSLGLDDQARNALLTRDAGALNDLLGGRPTMICALFPADDDQQKRDDDEPQEDTPDEQKESIRQRGLN